MVASALSSAGECGRFGGLGTLVLGGDAVDVEFAGRFDGCASERVGVGGEREGDERELLDLHVGCHRDRRELSEFDGAFSDDVAAEDGVELTVGDQFAKAGRSPVDDRSWQRVEPLGRDDDLVGRCGPSSR